NARKLLDAVPADARQDPGYLFAHAHVLRHENKIAEATQVLLSAPCDLAQVPDGEEWWVERRIMARKLLDMGDARSAYRVVAEGAEPTKENSRIERHFMAGWIALRFLDEPETAATHFTRIQDVTRHPTSHARSHYWLGRVAEAFHQPERARLAARLLRVSGRRRAALFAARPRHRCRYCGAVCHHSPGERVRSVRLVARPGDGADAGDAGSRTGYLQALQLQVRLQAPED